MRLILSNKRFRVVFLLVSSILMFVGVHGEALAGNGNRLFDSQ